ncbi:uncharacterized protein LOC127926322 isoform X3 [Oncorhynchus keta]|uniref:uncharacterized protein LOC127926322 isoform X3 n=1 Tax=Oncorhynchus keta TaxID=8018 RepID=UPI00227C1E98|nr:uncharacterized protein LOC127926322 isoform X3 [Oncorhynchus keta]
MDLSRQHVGRILQVKQTDRGKTYCNGKQAFQSVFFCLAPNEYNPGQLMENMRDSSIINPFLGAFSQERTGHPSEPGSSLPSTVRRGLATPQSLVPLYPEQPGEDWPPLRAWFLSTQNSQERTGHPSEPGSSLPRTARRGLATPQNLVPLYPEQPGEDWPPLRTWFLSTQNSQERTGHPSGLVPLYPVQPEEDWPPLRTWFLSTQNSQERTGHPSEPGSSLPSTARRGLATPQSLVPLYPVQPEEDWPPLRAWFLSTQYSQKRTGHPSEPGSSLPSTARRGLATPQSLVPLYPVQPEEDWPPLRAWFLSTQYSQKRTGHPT